MKEFFVVVAIFVSLGGGLIGLCVVVENCQYAGRVKRAEEKANFEAGAASYKKVESWTQMYTFIREDALNALEDGKLSRKEYKFLSSEVEKFQLMENRLKLNEQLEQWR